MVLDSEEPDVERHQDDENGGWGLSLGKKRYVTGQSERRIDVQVRAFWSATCARVQSGALGSRRCGRDEEMIFAMRLSLRLFQQRNS